MALAPSTLYLPWFSLFLLVLELATVPTPSSTEMQWYLLAKCSIRECVSACGNIGEEAGLEKKQQRVRGPEATEMLSPHHAHPSTAKVAVRYKKRLLLYFSGQSLSQPG